MITFNIGDNPDITWIFTKWIAGQLANFRSLEVSLAGIFLRYAYGIKVEFVIFSLGEPQHSFISSGKAL
ncbi:MAG: hypothetical protein AUK51_04550 [Comamonadaceae bacterium CG2_30_59_20]|nr:MAG: hypothetical protein AUK51_04550 [Comamonadaceae bacterium CG2_30_59_20]